MSFSLGDCGLLNMTDDVARLRVYLVIRHELFASFEVYIEVYFHLFRKKASSK